MDRVYHGCCSASFYRSLWVMMMMMMMLVLNKCGAAEEERESYCQSLDPSPSLAQFVDPLPFPPSLNLSSSSSSSPLTLAAFKILQKLHHDLPPTTMYAFGIDHDSATSPGPTLCATQHVPAYVRWENHINDTTHMLTIDETLHWANPSNGGVPIVVHLHGGEVESRSDGHPDAWWTYKGEIGSSFTSINHTYINEQSPMTLWYHDHTIGITRLNVLAGLSGMYIITSHAELSLLPIGLPLIIQDKQFYNDGSINFPNIGVLPDYHANWCAEYYGDTILVNGKIWPFFKVFPLAYRFRILNACNARFLVLSFNNPLVSFYQIGTDGGLLHEPWNLSSITMAPSERVDVVIDFSKLDNGSLVVLNNSGATPFPSGDIYQMPPTTYGIMQFIVDEEEGHEEGIVEEAFISNMDVSSALEIEKPMVVEEAVAWRMLGVVEWDDANHMPMVFTLDNKTWEEAVTQAPIEGTTEVWELMNLRINAHPIHIHLVQFQVINQQTFSNRSFELGNCSINVPYGEEASCFTEPPREPYTYQKGWKDTVITWPNVVTRVLIRFAQRDGSAFGFDPSIGPGYAWHCHIVDHEDNVMMRPFKVTPNSTLATIPRNTRDFY